LSTRLASLGAGLLIEALQQISTQSVRREKQNEAEATYAPVLKKEDGLIDWSRPARQIYNRLRGFAPWPGAYTTFRGYQLLVLSARVAEISRASPGTLQSDRRTLLAACGENSALELLGVQLGGKNRMSAQAFINGYKPSEHERLGD
jgi:methionyl-tRNA formyltransferase